MVSASVICLSSDDEASCRLSRSNEILNDAPLASPDEFASLIDEVDRTARCRSSGNQSPWKRRRISPPEPYLGESESPTYRAESLLELAAPKEDLAPKLKETTDQASLEDTDDILFTSSAPPAIGNAGSIGDADYLSDDSLPDDILTTTSHQNRTSTLSDRTATLLASFSEKDPRRKVVKDRKRANSKPSKANKIDSYDAPADKDFCNRENSLQKPFASVKEKSSGRTEEEKVIRKQQMEQDKEKRAREREKQKSISRVQKLKEKEEDQERKRLQKIDKAKERRIAADLAEVNKSKLDKKDSTPEMIVDLPASIDAQSTYTQTKEFFKTLGVDSTLYQSPVPNVIKWRRKVKARWNSVQDHWEPLDHMIIENEKHVLCIMSASEFVSLAMAQQKDPDIEMHVAKLKSAHEGCVLIYLIEGLQIWLRKNKAAENRAYQAKVLRQGPSAPGGPRSKRNFPTVEVIDEGMIEDALVRLQIVNNCLVHHTATSIDSSEWIANFTQHISTIPYRMQRMNLDTSFCMESGQVKTGEDKDDTFVKMLQEIVRVTPPIAYGIASEYSSVVALVKAFQRHGPLVLESLQKSANRNGAVTDRKIGPAISRRLYRVFMESDPASTDV